jgi:DNA mismatch endonuclease (patch repair protein)
VPKTRPDFWLDKIAKNQTRDELQVTALMSDGWRVLIIWECAVRFMKRQKNFLLIDQVGDWLVNGSEYCQIDEKSLVLESGS